MNGQRMRWIWRGFGLSLVMGIAMGCSSTEDRIENVVTHELEQCKQSDEVFHTVRTRTGSSFEILSELCHLEPSEVEMTNEWRGTIRTGPLVWMAEDDEDERAVLLRRVAWDELERATSYSNRQNPDAEDLQKAEEHFATAQQQYGDSSWVRMQRLENLLNLRAETMSSDDDETVAGTDAEAYYDEVLQWADAGNDAETKARARLAIVDHIGDYISRQQRSIETLGARDDRLKAAAEHAEDDGDSEAAEEYRQELKKRQEARPEVRETLQKRIDRATREACGYTGGLNVDDISEDALRTRITSTLRDYECDFSETETDDDEDGDD